MVSNSCPNLTELEAIKKLTFIEFDQIHTADSRQNTRHYEAVFFKVAKNMFYKECAHARWALRLDA